MKEYYKEFEGTLLYKHLIEKSETEQIDLVNKCINYCLPLLNLYVKTFPNYTLHNSTHQKNILDLTAKILGDKLIDLTGLETALIILSAVFHDIGMIFNESELENIEKEDAFRDFLKEKYEAKLVFEENNSIINEELAEWYCRWTHAKRVWIYLDNFEITKSKLEWEGISIKEKLGFICESHNDKALNLLDHKFEIEFLGKADLKLCAILLRLADIMDFDNSRTPESVYEYLKLSSSESKLKGTSNIEWEKHLASKGFIFDTNESETTLKFIAGPKHPQVEKNIELFLDIIEDELRECTQVLNSSSKRWRDSKIIPNSSINRTEIRSQGYKKGNYRLSLDEHQIITLLTGKNLYNSAFEFVRELLQNSIDTSRMREFHEHSKGNKSFKAKAIQLTSWSDTEGYRWFRIDDFGMGMNETVISNHLLNKGNSYYKSAYFKLQNLNYKKQTGQSFTPISRFGIGLLSCFILGDKVEINTRSIQSEQSNNKEEQIRLSIDGLINQYILQTEENKHIPLEFPKISNNWENGYRKEVGTSIAVRINRAKDYLQFEDHLKQTLNTYLTCSPITVYYNNSLLGVDFETLYQPLTESKFHVFPKEQKETIKDFFKEDIDAESGVEIISIDLTEDSANPNLMGQLLFLKLVLKFPDNISYKFDNDLIYNNEKFLKFIKSYRDETTNKQVDESIHIDLNFALEEGLKKCEKFLTYELHNQKAYVDTDINLIHNGINVPNKKYFTSASKSIEFENKIFDTFLNAQSSDHLCYGIIYLQDELIPDLSVSRNAIHNFGFQIYSSLYYATKKINDYIPEYRHFRYLNEQRETFNYHTIINDRLVKNGLWDNINLFQYNGENVSVNCLKTLIKIEPLKMALNDRPNHGFLFQLQLALLEINFDPTLEITNMSTPPSLLLQSINDKPNSLNNEHTPLLFLPFSGSGSSNIISYNSQINTEHVLTKWLLKNQELLIFEFKNYYIQLIDSILNRNLIFTNQILDSLRRTIPHTDFPPNLSDEDYQFIPF